MQSFPPNGRPGSVSEQTSRRRRCVNACETCKRRKERCNGLKPCGRCIERRVDHECFFAPPRRHLTKLTSAAKRQSTTRTIEIPRSTNVSPSANPDSLNSNRRHDRLSLSASPAIGFEQSRLIQDQKGRFMFIGDSANLSFLQIIRKLVRECIGSCTFVDDPFRHLMVEASPQGQPSWIDAQAQQATPNVSLADAQTLVKGYTFATNCVLDLFDEAELLDRLPGWVDGRTTECSIPSPIYYLILAIGAQTSSENRDDFAERLFTYGRYLTAQSFMEDASMYTIQSYALITMYLLGACRRNAAFMYLGIAVRAAYAIGLHRREVAASFSAEEFATRERLWKSLRILDLFMSSSLGRPPSTAETRDTEAEDNYSASIDLCAIFERILTDVYSVRMASTNALANISAHHRRWASRFSRGLANDRIEPAEVLQDSLPNIGLLHLKNAYYWTIMLLTRPFLTESITLHARTVASDESKPLEPCTLAGSNKVLVNACVDAAIRTIDLLKVLRGCKFLPKRLPLVNSAIFIAALVIGFACFGDLHQVFPLERHLKTAYELLALFTEDAIAQRNANILGYLREACNVYIEKRSAQNLNYQSIAVGSMFGQIHHRQRSRVPTREQSPTRRVHRIETVHLANNHSNSEDDMSRNVSTTMPVLPGNELVLDAPDTVYDLESDFDASSAPYAMMTPRTLWFDSYDEHMPLFSTISSNDFGTSVNGFG